MRKIGLSRTQLTWHLLSYQILDGSRNPIYSTSGLAYLVVNVAPPGRSRDLQFGLAEWYLPSIILLRSRRAIATGVS